MKVFFAACDIGCKEIWELEPPEHLLLSFAYPRELNNTLEHCRKNNLCAGIDLMLDSGAFSAWNKGVSVDIEKYLRRIEDIRRTCDFRNLFPVNLDVIPGKQGEKITRAQTEDAMLRGWKNYLWLKDRGVESIHVFHEGESLKFLVDTIVPNCPYIGVSPCNDSHLKQKIAWCKDAFTLLDERTKTHGFAVTSERLLELFPWSSVDSASWKLGANLGKVYLTLGQLYYSTVSDDANFDGEEINIIGEAQAMKEIRTLPIPSIQSMSDESVLDELKKSYRLRRQINYFHFKKLQERYTRTSYTAYRDPQGDFFRDFTVSGEL